MNVNELSEEQINNILTQYIKKREYDKNYYLEKIKDNVVHRDANRKQSLQYYYDHRESALAYQHKNRDKYKIINSYNYYKRNHRLDDFKLKYPERFEKMVEWGKHIQ